MGSLALSYLFAGAVAGSWVEGKLLLAESWVAFAGTGVLVEVFVGRAFLYFGAVAETVGIIPPSVEPVGGGTVASLDALAFASFFVEECVSSFAFKASLLVLINTKNNT